MRECANVTAPTGPPYAARRRHVAITASPMPIASSYDFPAAAAAPDPAGAASSSSSAPHPRPPPDATMSFGERALSAGAAAVLSAVVVNPLDIAKTRLQAQAAGAPPRSPNAYKGTLDVFYKVIRQEGFTRLWRGTNAGLVLAVPTAYRTGATPPGMWRTLVGVVSPLRSTNNHQILQSYRLLWTGIGTQLARDVPFSAICWSTLEPIRRKLLALAGDEGNVANVLGANFSAGFIAGSLAAAATCPLDVVKTRRQIEKDPVRALNMTTRLTLVEVWRNGGLKGLFTGVGPRVGRAGPSVGIVVSFYEMVKYVLHRRHLNSGA